VSDAPEEIRGVSTSIFSVGRTCGGITFMGHSYVYDSILDVLVREDVDRRRKKEAADERRARRRKGAAAQWTLPLGPATPATPG